jgi:hypothetical protein
VSLQERKIQKNINKKITFQVVSFSLLLTLLVAAVGTLSV